VASTHTHTHTQGTTAVFFLRSDGRCSVNRRGAQWRTTPANSVLTASCMASKPVLSGRTERNILRTATTATRGPQQGRKCSNENGTGERMAKKSKGKICREKPTGQDVPRGTKQTKAQRQACVLISKHTIATRCDTTCGKWQEAARESDSEGKPTRKHSRLGLREMGGKRHTRARVPQELQNAAVDRHSTIKQGPHRSREFRRS
jgi:hypothetical protein